MAANQNVIDELVVKITLDATDYRKNDKIVVQLVDQTEKKMVDVDKKRKTRDTAQKKRNQETLKSVKDLAGGIRSLALTVGSLLGIGSAAGIVGAVVALAGMETGLRRAAVSTGLSNRELQAYGSTIRRLGGDAQAGAQAVADLAREQKQFNLTGNAPTIQALSRLGVRVGPNTSVVDTLAQAQQIYRAAPQAQQGQIEAGLSAAGLGPDLILAIKSEKDIRETYARSYAESAEENRKAMDSVTDALTALANAASSVANSIATVAQPYIEQFSDFVSQGAQAVSGFVDRVMAAGGGVQGFMQVLDQESPQLATLLRDLNTGLTVFAQAIDLTTYGLKLIGEGFKSAFNFLDRITSVLTGGGEQTHPLRDAFSTIGEAIKWAWKSSLNDARTEGVTHLSEAASGAKLTTGAAQRLAAGALGGAARAAPVSADAAGIMNTLVTQYGMTVPQAAAEVASIKGESGFRPNAVSPDGGARGLYQWRGPRLAAFKARFGVNPDQATIAQQLEFAQTDPYERHLRALAFSGGGSAAELGARFSRIFEAHGNVAEDVRRGGTAGQLASAYGGSNGNGVGQQFNIQSVTVQANTPQEFVGGLQRLNTSQNYNSAVR